MQKSFANGKAYHYLIFIFILLLVVLAFYLSCRSKSPTEADSKLNNQVAAQSTNNSTTSSSTTTSVKPGQSPTNTTTLITSRNLTTTSIRTTTSSSSTTTTSRKPKPPTSSTTTTSIPAPILRWCFFYVARISGGSSVVSQQDQVVPLTVRDQGIVICQFEMKNIGTAATTNLTISINQIVGNVSHLNIQSSWAVFSSINQIPNTRDCTLATSWPCIIILLSGATSGEEFTITLIENVTQKTFSFKLHVT